MPFHALFSSPHCAVVSTFPLRGGQTRLALRVKELRCARKAPTTATVLPRVSELGLGPAGRGRGACPARAQRARFVRRIWVGGQQLPAFCGNVCQKKLGAEPKAQSYYFCSAPQKKLASCCFWVHHLHYTIKNNIVNTTSSTHHLHNIINATPSTLHQQKNIINTASSTHYLQNIINTTPSTLHQQKNIINTASSTHYLQNIINTTPSTLHH